MHSLLYSTFCNIHLFFTYFLLITSTKIAACIHRAPAKNYTKLTWIYRAIFHKYILTDYFSRVVSSKKECILYIFFSFHIAYYFMFVAIFLAYFIIEKNTCCNPYFVSKSIQQLQKWPMNFWQSLKQGRTQKFF